MTNSADAPTPSPSPEADGVGALPLPEDVPGPASPLSRRARREASTKTSKAGRDLPMAIGVGAGLLGLLMLGIFVLPPLFVALGAAVCVIGVWEVSRALQRHSGVPVPLLPLAVGAAAMPIAASYGGPAALGVAAVAAALLVTVWNALEGRASSLTSIGFSLLTLTWVPLLASFAFLLFREENGPLLLFSLLLLVVSNDTFGYIFGAWLGKHPMAPRISPKKSWEGFAGSVGGAMVVGVALCVFVLHLPWWVGLVLAAATAMAATAGDLAESMVKRELGIKDMSNLLPGHGGMMDRLDSMLFAVPIGYIVTVLSIGAFA
ncbi:MAG: phosphatidate cytidylyltransferase [Arthrobacter sp.]|jgi:phosphatidate cytidylyltransferase|nr:phosphatidate cytidylyltransferase [Arthrobacter sp.]